MSSGEKRPLASASRIANLIKDHVLLSSSRAVVAGSIRREKDLISDIEIVALPENREKLGLLISDFGQIIKPGTPDIIPWQFKSDAKYVRIWIPDESIKVDLFLANVNNWGGLLMMRTGSGTGLNGEPMSGFTTGMFSRWKKVSGGGRMNGAQPTTKSGEILPVKEEIDVFDLCKVKFVDPKQRTDRSVIKEYSYLRECQIQL